MRPIHETELIEEEREKDAAETMMQRDSAENSAKDPQSIFASYRMDNLRPIYEIVLERKTADTTEPHEPEADSERKKKKMETISSPLMEEQKIRPDPNIQKGESDSSSVGMEKFGRTEPHEPEADSEKKKKEMETIRSPLMEVQKIRPDPNIQKRESDSSSVRMEKFGKTEPHEPEADSEKKKNTQDLSIDKP